MGSRGWLLIGLALAIGILAVWVPSKLAQRQVAEALRPYVTPAGSLSVRARTTALAYPRGRIHRLGVDARGVRLGDLTAERLTASLTGVTLTQTPADGRLSMRARAGDLTVTIGREDIEQFLRARGLQSASVTIDAAGITARGAVRAGAVEVPARVSGRFVGAGRDLRFRLTSLEIGGVQLPPAMAGTLSGMIQPSVSLDALPFPIVIDRVSTDDGRVVVAARVEGAGP